MCFHNSYYDWRAPVVRRPLKYNGMTLFDYLTQKKEWMPMREMENILNTSPQMQSCLDGMYEIPSRLPRILVDFPANYTPYKGKYRQCKSSLC